MEDQGGYIRTGLSVPVMNIMVLLVIDIALATLVTTLVGLVNLLLMKRSVLRTGRASVTYGARYKEVVVLILVLTLGLAEFGIDGYNMPLKERKEVALTGMFRSNSPPLTANRDTESGKENEYAFYNETREGFTISYKAGSSWVEAVKLTNCNFWRRTTKKCADEFLNGTIPKPVKVKGGPMFLSQTKEYIVFLEAGDFFLTCRTYNNRIHDDYSCTSLMKLGGNKYRSFWDVMEIPVNTNFSAGTIFPKQRNNTKSDVYYNIDLNPDLPGWCYGFPSSCSVRFALGAGTSWDSVRSDLMNGITNESVTRKVETDVSSVVIRAQIAHWAIGFLLASVILLIAMLVTLKIVNHCHVIKLDLANVRNAVQRKHDKSSAHEEDRRSFFWTLKKRDLKTWDICVDADVGACNPYLGDSDKIF